jgi:hypothetical protein
MLSMSFKAVKARRARFVDARRGVSQADDEFIARCASEANPMERRLVIALRRAVATECGVAPESLVADDSTQELESLMSGSGFFLEAILGGEPFDPHAFSDAVMVTIIREYKAEDPPWNESICQAIPAFWKADKTHPEPRSLGEWAIRLSRFMIKAVAKDQG